jgi:hypothetical protein
MGCQYFSVMTVLNLHLQQALGEWRMSPVLQGGRGCQSESAGITGGLMGCQYLSVMTVLSLHLQQALNKWR